ncbi:GyrI-like domain-containing protein [Allomuricauda sp. SCSIO 65647]|uniref:GyrI-like domain-containing protein n=1 Tax=Allomuricauda sp. SCSIO 65647 TaxID=2908843 RepID=UPI001F1CDF0A|nr:GyrI-like domain-containing protein [Muricauda sp. SCSIO 65647]UJH68523.1 GyrI-like domain-containing protein [Muricauda sp. SCSIO 65647]
MEKIDYKKRLKHLYRPSAKEVGFVEVPEMNFLMVDGQGNPNTARAYKEAVEALYALSYSLKFMVKKGDIGIDYGVLPLEGLWWMDDMSNFDPDNKDEWKWTSMIMQPDFITKQHVQEAIEQVRRKKNPKALDKIRFASFNEGKTAQLMHIGPFSEEGPNIEKVHKAIEDAGFERKGKHHEIYLSDIRRAAPEKWKTVIRQPYQ